jgi:hypothetical protein
MNADAAAAELVRLMSSKKVDDRVKLAAAKDLLDRANLAGTQNIEVGVTKRDFSDVTADVVMDLSWDEEGDPLSITSDIVVAELVDDEEEDNERWEREDAHTERAKEFARMRRGQPIPADPDLSHERAERERPHMRQEPTRRVSMADPHADRFPERGGRRSMSPKRYEQREREGRQG